MGMPATYLANLATGRVMYNDMDKGQAVQLCKNHEPADWALGQPMNAQHVWFRWGGIVDTHEQARTQQLKEVKTMNELTAQDALDDLLGDAPPNMMRVPRVEDALIIALREIIALKKRLDEKPGDWRRDSEGNPLGFVLPDGSLQVAGRVPGVKMEGDYIVQQSADDRFYGIDPQYKIDMFKQRDFEIAIKALQQIADVNNNKYDGDVCMDIASDALTAIDRELPKLDEDDND